MDKSVLISINPQWCEKIAAFEKTYEVRKTRPKIDRPFKVYIYATAGRFSYKLPSGFMRNSMGKCIIGEFTCDRIIDIQRRGYDDNFDYCYQSLNTWGNDDIELEIRAIEGSCIPKEELNAYAARNRHLYAWHITNLKIYNIPKLLTDFLLAEKKAINRDGSDKRILIPPQSWMYVKEDK